MKKTQKFCVGCGAQLHPLKSDSAKHPGQQPPPSYSAGNVRYSQGHYTAARQQNRYAYLQNVPITKRNFWKYMAPYTTALLLIYLFIGLFVFFVFSSQDNIFFLIDFLDRGGFIIFTIFPLLVIAGSIIYVFYFYKSAEDYEKLHYKTHNPYPAPQKPVLLLILFFVFRPLAYFLKHNQLRQHLKQEHNHTEDLPYSGVVVLIIVFLPVTVLVFGFIILYIVDVFLDSFLIVLIASVLISPLLLLHAESKWQTALNHHIDFHDAGQASSF